MLWGESKARGTCSPLKLKISTKPTLEEMQDLFTSGLRAAKVDYQPLHVQMVVLMDCPAEWSSRF